jgi:hypothetical protein
MGKRETEKKERKIQDEKERELGRKYEGRLKSSWSGDSVPLLCRGRHNTY